jgi:hypothetical protein
MNYIYTTGYCSNMAAQTEAEFQDTKNSLSSGLMHVLQPSIEALDYKVNSVRWGISWNPCSVH